jgi:tetratricopeptide (TPR) repeat protein
MAKLFQPSEKINRAALEVLPIIEAGEKEKALSKISTFQDSEPGARYTLARLLISTGQARRSRVILECGTEAFERLKAKSAPPNDPSLYYDVANGYHELYSIAVHGDHANVFDCEDSARKALRYAERGPKGDTWALTNLGNLYDEVGRPIEALRTYDRALAIDPNFGMVLATGV